jgi:hypothetical protein
MGRMFNGFRSLARLRFVAFVSRVFLIADHQWTLNGTQLNRAF